MDTMETMEYHPAEQKEVRGYGWYEDLYGGGRQLLRRYVP